MFEKIKKAIRRREQQKKRTAIKEAEQFVYQTHWFWEGLDGTHYGSGRVDHKGWKLFMQLRHDGIIYDVKREAEQRVYGAIVSVHLTYKIKDVDRLFEVMDSHGWMAAKK